MAEPPAHHAAPRRAGSIAAIVGALSLLCALVPVVGDIVSVPLALVAIVCGVLGVGHYDSGRAPRMPPAPACALLVGLSLVPTLVPVLSSNRCDGRPARFDCL